MPRSRQLVKGLNCGVPLDLGKNKLDSPQRQLGGTHLLDVLPENSNGFVIWATLHAITTGHISDLLSR